MPQPSLRRRSARVRPYVLRRVAPAAVVAPPTARETHPSLLARVVAGLRALPASPPVPNTHAAPPSTVQPQDGRTPLIRHIDAERARTAVDRTPTEEIPVIGQGVSWR